MVPTYTQTSEIGLGEATLFLLLGERQILSLVATLTIFTWNIILLENIVVLNLIFLIRNASCDEFLQQEISQYYHLNSSVSFKMK